jgi:putative hydrolase of the HAD superfamily
MSQSNKSIKTLLIDIGGVILTNGWDRHSRQKAIETFHLNKEEVDERHGLAFDPYEEGKFTLDEYLNYAIFYCERDFTMDQFKNFMFAQSQPLVPMLHLVQNLKTRYDLQVVAISNEGREIMDYRTHTFKLKEFIDVFVCSAFVGMRKPDPAIYHLVIDVAQLDPHSTIYIDDRQLLAEMGKQFGLHYIHHVNVEQTEQAILKLIAH